MSNPFKNRATSLTGPALDIEPVVPNDGADLTVPAISLYVETGGAVAFVSEKGLTRTVVVGDFAILPVGVRRVLATGTTASGLHAFTL